MAVLRTNGVTLHYEITGTGPPLCLIIGYRLHAGAWPRAFVEGLARHFTVLTLDNRGTGRSEKPDDGYSIEIMADDVIGLLDGLGWQRAHVLGFSMGGAVAQDLAIRAPEKVARLVLFATFPGGMFSIPASWAVLRRLFGIEGLPPEDAARLMWPVTYSPEYLEGHEDEVVAQMRREIAYPTPAHVARGQSAAIRAFSSTFRLSRIVAPTLVASGTEDRLVPAGNSRIIASHVLGARLALVPKLAHRAIWEAPDRIVRLVSDFLTETTAPST